MALVKTASSPKVSDDLKLRSPRFADPKKSDPTIPRRHSIDHDKYSKIERSGSVSTSSNNPRTSPTHSKPHTRTSSGEKLSTVEKPTILESSTERERPKTEGNIIIIIIYTDNMTIIYVFTREVKWKTYLIN